MPNTHGSGNNQFGVAFPNSIDDSESSQLCDDGGGGKHHGSRRLLFQHYWPQQLRQGRRRVHNANGNEQWKHRGRLPRFPVQLRQQCCCCRGDHANDAGHRTLATTPFATATLPTDAIHLLRIRLAHLVHLFQPRGPKQQQLQPKSTTVATPIAAADDRRKPDAQQLNPFVAPVSH